MAESFPHLKLQREEPVTEKRAGRFRPYRAPDDAVAHARNLQKSLDRTKIQTDGDIGGFDERRLFRFSVIKGFDPDSLRRLSNEIELVSQEGEEVIVAFVSSAALESFEARLASMAKGESVTARDVIHALQRVDGWSEEDRTGWALRHQGFPDGDSFVLDVELWPLEDSPGARKRLWLGFENWLKEQQIRNLDSVKQQGLSLFRIRCDRNQAERLLRHRDVRTVDLPPRFRLDRRFLHADIQNLPPPPAPSETAPGVVVLDSGLATNHPLLAPAVGDAQSFLLGKDATDENGHGTHVAGIALYGDIEACLRNRHFVPKFWLFSGRILDENNENNTGFVENQIARAVQYFHEQYGCKIYNLSFGDINKPYLGGHVRGLAYTLDTLSRSLGVLFVVSTGNVLGSQLHGLQWKNQYPDFLGDPKWAIVDPATALNVITVGSIARYDQSFYSQRNPSDPTEIPIARREQPSPFTRHGPSVGGACKPELIDYGGNWAINTRAGADYLTAGGLGELSTDREFAGGRLLAEFSGTSMAAPHVAHLAASVLAEYPEANANMIRALLLAHAAVPGACRALLTDEDILRCVCGYGVTDSGALFRSLENEVTLLAQTAIPNKRHHFYEIPVPEDFVAKGRRLREITVALAYTPYVRSTRIAYKATRMDFRVVAAPDLNNVSTMFNKATEKNDYQNIPELRTPDINGRFRGKGTAQAATWRFSQFNSNSILKSNRLFVVVTRNDHPWGEVHSSTEENYAIVACLRDRENAQARLYTQLRARLRQRARVKV